MKVVRLSALHSGRLYQRGGSPGTYFCQGLSRPQGHSEGGGIKSTKNLSDIMGIEFATLLMQRSASTNRVNTCPVFRVTSFNKTVR